MRVGHAGRDAVKHRIHANIATQHVRPHIGGDQPTERVQPVWPARGSSCPRRSTSPGRPLPTFRRRTAAGQSETRASRASTSAVLPSLPAGPIANCTGAWRSSPRGAAARRGCLARHLSRRREPLSSGKTSHRLALDGCGAVVSNRDGCARKRLRRWARGPTGQVSAPDLTPDSIGGAEEDRTPDLCSAEKDRPWSRRRR